MKRHLKLFCAGMFMSTLCTAFAACNDSLSEEQRRIELAKLTDDVYYVVGSYANMVEFQDDGTAKCGAYLFISENLQDTVCVYNATKDWRPGALFDGLFEFPAEIMNTSILGYILFPEEYRYSYKVRINSHRPRREDETFAGASDAFHYYSNLRPNKYIVVESLTKID